MVDGRSHHRWCEHLGPGPVAAASQGCIVGALLDDGGGHHPWEVGG